jgi:oligoendopeptidase F
VGKKQPKKGKKKAGSGKARGEVWNLEPILGGMKYEDFASIMEEKVKLFEGYRNILSPEMAPAKLLEVIKLDEEVGVLFSRISSYYSLKTSENTKDEESLAKLSALNVLNSDFHARTLFFELWFLSLDDKTAARYIDSRELSAYRQFLVNIRAFKPYTKSEEVEKILALKDVTGGDAFSSLYEIFIGGFKFDIDGRKNLTQDQAAAYYMSEKPAFREAAYRMVYGKYRDEGVLLSEIYKDIVLDWYNESVKIRGYRTPLSVRNLGNNVDDAFVETLIRVVKKNVHLNAEYFRIKHRLLNSRGQKFRHSRFHIYAPYRKVAKKYSYEESKKIVLDTFGRLDPRFAAAAKKMFDEGHVHSHPKPGKRGGAFCSTVSSRITPYVLLNHTDDAHSLSTMMHELGHGIHSLFASDKPDLLSHSKIPLAETASVFSEILLAHRMMGEFTDKEDKISLLVSMLDDHYKSIVRQVYFVILESWAHEHIKEGATRQEINDYYHSLLKEQFGNMEIPELFDSEWLYQMHIFCYPFYCYGYAWGNLLSLSLYAMYREQGKKFVDKYIEFLSAGSSRSVLDIMLAVGADPGKEEFWQKGFDIIRADLEELKRLAGKK